MSATVKRWDFGVAWAIVSGRHQWLVTEPMTPSDPDYTPPGDRLDALIADNVDVFVRATLSWSPIDGLGLVASLVLEDGFFVRELERVRNLTYGYPLFQAIYHVIGECCHQADWAARYGETQREWEGAKRRRKEDSNV